jgi:hypothetical protein
MRAKANKRARQDNGSCVMICLKLFVIIKFVDCVRGLYHEARRGSLTAAAKICYDNNNLTIFSNLVS